MSVWNKISVYCFWLWILSPVLQDSSGVTSMCVCLKTKVVWYHLPRLFTSMLQDCAAPGFEMAVEIHPLVWGRGGAARASAKCFTRAWNCPVSSRPGCIETNTRSVWSLYRPCQVESGGFGASALCEFILCLFVLAMSLVLALKTLWNLLCCLQPKDESIPQAIMGSTVSVNPVKKAEFATAPPSIRADTCMQWGKLSICLLNVPSRNLWLLVGF